VAVSFFGCVTALVGPISSRRVINRVQKAFTDCHIAVYRASRGRVMGWFDTAPILLLTTVGRRSKEERTVPVMYIPGEVPVVVASNGGAKDHPQWYLNLKANPRARVQIAVKVYEVSARDASDSERDELWQRAIEIYPAYARYQRQTHRQIPVVVLGPVGGEAFCSESHLT
jgi:deazaflavin-dependent oxidoreductase (nitroreductase family)